MVVRWNVAQSCCTSAHFISSHRLTMQYLHGGAKVFIASRQRQRGRGHRQRRSVLASSAKLSVITVAAAAELMFWCVNRHDAAIRQRRGAAASATAKPTDAMMRDFIIQITFHHSCCSAWCCCCCCSLCSHNVMLVQFAHRKLSVYFSSSFDASATFITTTASFPTNLTMTPFNVNMVGAVYARCTW